MTEYSRQYKRIISEGTLVRACNSWMPNLTQTYKLEQPPPRSIASVTSGPGVDKSFNVADPSFDLSVDFVSGMDPRNAPFLPESDVAMATSDPSLRKFVVQKCAPPPRRSPLSGSMEAGGSTAGVGLLLVHRNPRDDIYVKDVVADGAAALDGRISVGDQILSIDGESMEGMDLNSVWDR